MNKTNTVSAICLIALIVTTATTGCDKQKQQVKNISSYEYDRGWEKLSLREKIGQLVCFNYSKDIIAQYGDGSIDTLLSRYPVGSVFLANWNMKPEVPGDSLSQHYQNTVEQFSKLSKYPMLFAEDFEAGIGMELKDYTTTTSEMGVGATNSEEAAYSMGDIISMEARGIGINWLLHPIADLNTNPGNFLTNVRAISDDENIAIRLLPKQVNAMQNNGVAATAKHFPGDGTDFINQHFSTSTMQLSYHDWKQKHGKVFQTLIDSGVAVIMAGHITFPAYQQEKLNGEYLPATLSKELMTDLLKKEMGFKGVVVSDALNMAGISGYYENQLETEIESFKAGADILLWPKLEIIDSLKMRILRKEIPIERLNDAVSRVWNLKKQLGLLDDNYSSIEELSRKELEENKKKAYQIAEKSVTLLDDKNKQLPLDTTKSKKLLIVSISEKKGAEVFDTMKKELLKRGYEVEIRDDLSYFDLGDNLDSISTKYDKFIFTFSSNPGNPWGTLSLNNTKALSMWTANKLPLNKVISIGFGDPYKNLIYMPRIWCRINCYQTDNNTQLALVKGLTGEIELTGKSPVTYNTPYYQGN